MQILFARDVRIRSPGIAALATIRRQFVAQARPVPAPAGQTA